MKAKEYTMTITRPVVFAQYEYGKIEVSLKFDISEGMEPGQADEIWNKINHRLNELEKKEHENYDKK